MLTTNLVRVRRRRSQIEPASLSDRQYKVLQRVAQSYVTLATSYEGRTRQELEEAYDRVPYEAIDHKLVWGLRKLVFDRCEFQVCCQVNPPALRRAIFTRAAVIRMNATELAPFDRESVIDSAIEGFTISADEVNEALFADLKGNHKLICFDPISGEALVERYEMAQRQAILLRAIRLVVCLRCVNAGQYRAFFNQLKFRQLLYKACRMPSGGYEIEIDGPFSLFQEMTKYGLQLALLLPILQESGQWHLEAEVRWDKNKPPYRYSLQGDARGSARSPEAQLPESIAKLMEVFKKLDSSWKVSPSDRLLSLPGEGLCVPDLCFEHEQSAKVVYLEVMGYWSRQAVWRRVELIQAGLPYRIIFAVSSRLRVSEAVLDKELPGQLYVYKGVMSARSILDRLQQMELEL